MSTATRILTALVAGLLIGIGLSSWAPAAGQIGLGIADPIGTMWLNGLRMTIVPLVTALLVTGIGATAQAARASRLAGRALVLFLAMLTLSAIIGALVTLGLLDLFPVGANASAALRSAVASSAPVGEVPPFSQFLTAIVPTNPLNAAANDAFLPLILFTTVFAFAVTRLPDASRTLITNFFQAIADTMLIVIRWVLWLAPVGVFALAFVVGNRAGTAAFGALLHYVTIVASAGFVIALLSIPLAVFGGRVSPSAFFRAMPQPFAVALSTQSSLASLPAMLRASEGLGVPVATSGIVLPLAVAILRSTGPAMNVAVAIYVAHLFGLVLTPAQIATGVVVAALTSLGAVSLPGTISFVSSIAPVALAMGLPIEPLALLVAVETFPDIMRTLGNVAMDVAVTATLGRRGGDAGPPTSSDALLSEAP